MEEEVQNFSIYKRNDLIIIKNNKSLNVNNFCLEINIVDFTPALIEEKELTDKKLYDCIGIIGIITLEDDTYLIVITEAKLICTITKKEIYKVLNTAFIKFSEDEEDEKEEESEKNNKNNENENYYFKNNHDEEIIKNLKEIFKNGFYFSNKYDLANSLTSQNQITNFFKNSKILISNYDYIAEGNKNFLSNWKLTAKVMSLDEKNKIKYYFSNCIYGNIEEFTYEKENIQIILISRRYLWNYGMYSYRRGLSKYGGNSNQIETELILIHNKKEIYSNIHLSCYIPIYYKTKKNLNMVEANKSFVKYFQNLIDEYNVLFLFVLKNKDEEDKYISKFKNMLLKNIKAMPNKWKYYYINTKNRTIQSKLKPQNNGKNMIDYIGFNILKDNTQFDTNKNQIGILSLLAMDDKSLNRNEIILIYETLYHIINYMNKEKKISFFLDKDINLDLLKEENENENEDKHNTEKKDNIENNNKTENEEKIENVENNTNIENEEKMENNNNTENHINIENEEKVEKVEKLEKIETLKINENENIIDENISEDSLNLINNLKILFKNRDKELTKQYYTNYEDDLTKKYQRAYEILFGKNMKYSSVQKNLDYLKEEFCDLEDIKVYVGTWNTASTDFNKIKDINLDLWLKPKDPNLIPDIYFIGFQEVVELSATNVIMISEEKQQQILDEWDKKIIETIQKVGNYEKLVEMNLVGINFYFYILEEKSKKVKNISKKLVKTGLGGATGNKGSCCINFEYENTSFSIACSHLAAGNKNKQRLKELDFVLNLKLNTFFNPNILEEKTKDLDLVNQSLEEVMPSEDENKIMTANTFTNLNTINLQKIISTELNNNNNININNDSTLFKDSDIWILFGDLNFRVDMEYEEFSQYLKKGSNNFNKLLDYDQFIKFKLASIDSMASIQEDEIKFPPTYKYIINSDEYDYTPENVTMSQNLNENPNLKKSGKKRNPSWCDRIIYKKNSYTTKDGKKIITGIEYNNVMGENFQTSDHRPIYQIFDVKIFKENQDKKQLIEKEIISNEKLGISSKYMKKKNYDY